MTTDTSGACSNWLSGLHSLEFRQWQHLICLVSLSVFAEKCGTATLISLNNIANLTDLFQNIPELSIGVFIKWIKIISHSATEEDRILRIK